MSQNVSSWVVRPLTLAFATVLSLVLSVCGVAPAHADATYTAPPPVSYDLCGTDQDRLEIPADFSHPVKGFGGYYIDGVSSYNGTYTMSGKGAVVVTTSYDSGSWTFTYTNDPCPPEAVNTVDVQVGACNPVSGLSPMLVTFTNVADSTGWSISDGLIKLWTVETGEFQKAYAITGVADGGSISYQVGSGASPGTWKVVASQTRFTDVTAFARVESCNDTLPFPGATPAPAPSIVSKVKATLKRVDRVLYKACVDARKFTARAALRYRITSSKAGKAVRLARGSAKAGSRVCRLVRPPHGSVIKVMYKDQQLRKWTELVRRRAF